MKVKVELPDEFEANLRDAILAMARESFEVVKNEARYPDYMRINEATNFLNCGRSTITSKFFPAGLKVINIDGLQYVSKKDAIAFMNEHKH